MSGKTLLVIDDDVSVLETIDFVLSSNGYNLLLASDGEEGLAIVKDQWIDGIVLDLKMPKVSGYLFATLVDEASLNKNVKILLLSGQSLMAGDCQIKLPNIVSKLTKRLKLKI